MFDPRFMRPGFSNPMGPGMMAPHLPQGGMMAPSNPTPGLMAPHPGMMRHGFGQMGGQPGQPPMASPMQGAQPDQGGAPMMPQFSREEISQMLGHMLQGGGMPGRFAGFFGGGGGGAY